MTKTEAIHLWFAFEKELGDPAPPLTEKLLKEAVGKLYALVPPPDLLKDLNSTED